MHRVRAVALSSWPGFLVCCANDHQPATVASSSDYLSLAFPSAAINGGLAVRLSLEPAVFVVRVLHILLLLFRRRQRSHRV